jgi:hypothetical protein
MEQMTNNKQQYIQFCKENPDIPIFSQPWWLDVVCSDQWDVILIKKNNRIIASFPYYITKKRELFTHISMPPLTQKLGPYIVYDVNKTTEDKRINYEHGIYNEIINKIPQCDVFMINFDQKYKNWLPFYWRGFKQTTRYTYILENIKDHDYITRKYSKSKKQPIQKAKEKLKFKFDLSEDIFYTYFKDVINERNEKVDFSKNLFTRLYNAVYENCAGKVFYCDDNENNIHAINMIVWDKECAYYLFAMRKKEYNTSGGTEFLLDETIKYISQFVDNFDFEGSMIKGVEESYRRYGAHQTEYYRIFKYNNPILRIIRGIRDNY